MIVPVVQDPILCVVGAHPNFMKIAPVIRARKEAEGVAVIQLAVTEDILHTGGKAGRIPELWDGHAAHRIAASLRQWLDGKAPR